MKKLYIYLFSFVFFPAAIFGASGYPGYYELDLTKTENLKNAIATLPESDKNNYLVTELLEVLDKKPDSVMKEEFLIEAAKTKAFVEIANREAGLCFTFSQLYKKKSPIQDFQEHARKVLEGKNDNSYDRIIKEYVGEIGKLESLMSLYQAYLHRYDSEQHLPITNFINDKILGITPNYDYDIEMRKKLYGFFIKTEFLIPLKGLGESSKLLPITSNLEVAIDAFIKKRGSFDTLILGNGYALDAATADALGVRQVGCGMEKVTLEDLTAKGLWVDMQSSAEPDVVGDMTNSSLYLAIQKLQGPKCLTKISDRAWLQASYLDDDKVLSLIKSLLKDDGIFEILDSGFFWDGVLEDKNRVLIDKMSKVGFIYEGCDIERKALLFRPKN